MLSLFFKWEKPLQGPSLDFIMLITMRILSISWANIGATGRSRTYFNLYSSGEEIPRTLMCLILTRHHWLCHGFLTKGEWQESHRSVCSWFCSHSKIIHSQQIYASMGSKAKKSSPYHDRPPISHHTNSPWHHSPTATLPVTACIFINAGPHYP